MGINKEQEKILNDMSERNETETQYVCEDCAMRLNGMIRVREHCSINKHYSYSRPGSKGVIGFV